MFSRTFLLVLAIYDASAHSGTVRAVLVIEAPLTTLTAHSPSVDGLAVFVFPPRRNPVEQSCDRKNLEIYAPHGKSSEPVVGIVGGHTIPIESAPYMASLRLNGTHHWCGGAVIHRRFVVTAAHCIVPNREYKISVGSNSIERGGALLDVEELIIHEKYDPNGDYDICLVKLKEEIALGEKVSLISLADFSLKLKTGTMMNITGWGNSKENGTVSTHLQQAAVPLVGRRSCKFTYMAFLHPISARMICAGEVGRDACQGDSGGPLTYKDHLVGVSSFGVGCGTYPGVYTKISAMLPWIMEKIDENS